MSISNVENELSVRDSAITHVTVLQRFFFAESHKAKWERWNDRKKNTVGGERGFNNKFHDGYKSHVQHWKIDDKVNIIERNIMAMVYQFGFR